MSKPLPPKYQTTNLQAYKQSLKQGGQLLFWLDKGMNWQALATGKRGRQPTCSDAAIQFYLTIKCLFGLALRQATGMVESILHLAGRLGCPQLQHAFPSPERTAGAHSSTEEAGLSASAGGWHRYQDDGRRRVEGKKAWR